MPTIFFLDLNEASRLPVAPNCSMRGQFGRLIELRFSALLPLDATLWPSYAEASELPEGRGISLFPISGKIIATTCCWASRLAISFAWE